MELEVIKCNWVPATDNEIGEISFEANTPKGVFAWREELPRPGESGESCEKEAWLNGIPVKLEEIDEYPELGLPATPSKSSHRCKACLALTVKEVLEDWGKYWFTEDDLPT